MYVYSISGDIIEETLVVARQDRVYAVACNPDGSRMVVGGRDKKVALVDEVTVACLCCVLV